MSILLTTTGTSSPIVINDFGAMEFVHPVVNYDLTDEFTYQEIRESSDLGLALNAGYLSLNNDGETITTSAGLANLQPVRKVTGAGEMQFEDIWLNNIVSIGTVPAGKMAIYAKSDGMVYKKIGAVESLLDTVTVATTVYRQYKADDATRTTTSTAAVYPNITSVTLTGLTVGVVYALNFSVEAANGNAGQKTYCRVFLGATQVFEGTSNANVVNKFQAQSGLATFIATATTQVVQLTGAVSGSTGSFRNFRVLTIQL